jgi:hypothetical protein
LGPHASRRFAALCAATLLSMRAQEVARGLVFARERQAALRLAHRESAGRDEHACYVLAPGTLVDIQSLLMIERRDTDRKLHGALAERATRNAWLNAGHVTNCTRQRPMGRLLPAGTSSAAVSLAMCCTSHKSPFFMPRLRNCAARANMKDSLSIERPGPKCGALRRKACRERR